MEGDNANKDVFGVMDLQNPPELESLSQRPQNQLMPDLPEKEAKQEQSPQQEKKVMEEVNESPPQPKEPEVQAKAEEPEMVPEQSQQPQEEQLVKKEEKGQPEVKIEQAQSKSTRKPQNKKKKAPKKTEELSEQEFSCGQKKSKKVKKVETAHKAEESKKPHEINKTQQRKRTRPPKINLQQQAQLLPSQPIYTPPIAAQPAMTFSLPSVPSEPNIHRMGEQGSLAARSQAAVQNEQLKQLKWFHQQMDEEGSERGDIDEKSVENRLRSRTSVLLERMLERGGSLTDQQILDLPPVDY